MRIGCLCDFLGDLREIHEQRSNTIKQIDILAVNLVCSQETADNMSINNSTLAMIVLFMLTGEIKELRSRAVHTFTDIAETNMNRT